MNQLIWTLPLIAGAGIVARGVFSPASSMFVPTISRLNTGEENIALTFDDGPWPGSTDQILDALAYSHMQATFFVIGKYLERHSDLVRRIHDEGHQIGNHTFDHHRSGLLKGPKYWHEQLTRTDDAIEKITGRRPTCFRPPMGFKAPTQALALKNSGHQVIAWSLRARDGVETSTDRIMNACSRLMSNDILLLHDGRDPLSQRDVSVTAGALPGLLALMHDRGFTSIRLDDGIKGV